ncbi:MAG: hypothetical protein AAGC93_15315, partial [Cyanobacteria bacterium P01_F01_bin.53]
PTEVRFQTRNGRICHHRITLRVGGHGNPMAQGSCFAVIVKKRMRFPWVRRRLYLHSAINVYSMQTPQPRPKKRHDQVHEFIQVTYQQGLPSVV